MFDAPPPSPSPAPGVLIWFVAAGALVIGIVIGYFSGYRAAERGGLEPAVAEIFEASPAQTRSESTTAGSVQTFSEATVSEAPAPQPVIVDPAPVVVAAPEPEREPVPARSTRPDRADRSNVPTVSNAANVPNDRPGSIEVLSRPIGAQVILDGRIVGRTPLSIADVSPGTHSIRLELPSYNRWATTVDVNPGARARVAASLEQP